MKTQKRVPLHQFINPNRYDREGILEQLQDIPKPTMTDKESSAIYQIIQGIQYFWKLEWIDQYLNTRGLPTTSEIFLGFEIDMVYQPKLIDILNFLGVCKFNDMIMWEYLGEGYIKQYLEDMEEEHGSQVPSQMAKEQKSRWNYILVDNRVTVDNFPWEELNHYMTHYAQLVEHNVILAVVDSNITE